MGEMPLEIRIQLALTYWTNLRGHNKSHSAQSILKPCQKNEKGQTKSFGWTIENNVKQKGQY